MSSGSTSRSRAVRVNRRVVIPGRTAQWLAWGRDPVVWRNLGIAMGAALCLLVLSGAWAPGFPYRSGYVPGRDITARVAFRMRDEAATEARRRQARAETVCIYRNDPQPLVELRKALKNHLFQLLSTPPTSPQAPEYWRDFLPPESPPDQIPTVYQQIHQILADDKELTRFERGLQLALADAERNGLLESLTHRMEDGSQMTLWVYPAGSPQSRHRVEVREVRIAEVMARLDENLEEGFAGAGFDQSQAALLAGLAAQWIRIHKLPVTLSLDEDASEAERRKAEQSVEPVEVSYLVGTRLVPAGRPLGDAELALLRREYQAMLDQLDSWSILARSCAVLGMYLALYVLCGTYCYFHEVRLLSDPRRLAQMLAVVVVTVCLAISTSRGGWRAETIPLTLLALTVTIAYHRELALLVSAAVGLIVVVTVGFELPEFILLVASAAAPALLLGRVRHRTHLLVVGTLAAAMVAATTAGLGTLFGQPFAAPNPSAFYQRWFPPDSPITFIALLAAGSCWYGFASILAALLMTGLLPFVERWFDVQTDLSLLELGDPAHPLLQELARRAPGTYNHSINVAALAEAAAEAIGANGLLARVGAYFHDIGKMLKPEYFVENQGTGGNPHGGLVPAMSTLVIISHVKDGVELARRHRLPQSIIDFIEQHHGTTLVAYFYDQAAKRHAGDPDYGELDEGSFRYPGPKPQTKEAAVMMLADAAESACRTLVDPNPSRIENLIHEIALNKLLDGQFDECNLTLRELRLIEESLVKSVTAFYHSRVKYPQQQTV
ncbi:MAG: 7TM receptor with intracellular metal dependent phosphohydrolase [Pirellulaceae bacterium]|nr:MAG: 7TM receptor with intracellular metal dependent phosphohydrolase [Pirellulaceae bacterium]